MDSQKQEQETKPTKTKAEKAEVKVGQRYEDTDKRYPGRVVEVLTVAPPRALVKTPSGRKVSIRIDRLQGKWYRLLGTKKEDGK